MLLSLDGTGPLYRQVTRALRRSIERGDFVAGERLPGTRRLADDLGVSRNIVIMAFDQLVIEGYVESRVGAGTVVSTARSAMPVNHKHQKTVPVRLPMLAPAGRRLVDAASAGLALAAHRGAVKYNFEYGQVEPDETTRRQWRRVLPQSMAAGSFDYGAPAGTLALRKAVAQHLNSQRGLGTSEHNVVMVSGSQQALDLIARLFVGENDVVAIEDPQYQGARQAFVAAGGRLSTCEVDAEGMIIPANLSGARVAYLTPSHQFPTGVVMSARRRFELLRWAATNNTLIVEDDYDSEFRYDTSPVQALAGMPGDAAVIYVGTFAKSLYPGLRLGYLVAPAPIAAQLSAAKWLTDRCSPVPLQQALATFMHSGDYRRHLRRMRRRYATARSVLVNALRTLLGDQVVIAGGDAGIHLVVWFPGLDVGMEQRLVTLAQEAGCAVYPIAGYYRDPNRQKYPGLILGYSSIDTGDIQPAVLRLAQAWHATLSTGKRVS